MKRRKIHQQQPSQVPQLSNIYEELNNLLTNYHKLKKKTFNTVSLEAFNFYQKYGFVQFRLLNDEKESESYINGDHKQQKQEANGKEDLLFLMKKHRQNIQTHLSHYGLSDDTLMNLNSEDLKLHLNKIKKSKKYPYKFNIGWIFGTEYEQQQQHYNEDEEEYKQNNDNTEAYSEEEECILKLNFFFDEKTNHMKSGSLYDYISQSEYAWRLRDKCFPYYKKLYNYFDNNNNNNDNNHVRDINKEDGNNNNQSKIDDNDDDDWFSSIEHSHFLFNSLKIKENLIQETDKLHFLPGIFKNKKIFNDIYLPSQSLSCEERLKYPRGFLYCGGNISNAFTIVPGLFNLRFKELVEKCLPPTTSTISNIKTTENNMTLEEEEEDKFTLSSSSSSLPSYFSKRTLVRAIPPKELKLEEYVLHLELKPGDYVIYNPCLPTRFDHSFNNVKDDHFYGINIMFMQKSYIFRNLNPLITKYYFNERNVAFISKQILNNERLFGHMMGSIFEKKRGKKYICKVKKIPNEFIASHYHYRKLLF